MMITVNDILGDKGSKDFERYQRCKEQIAEKVWLSDDDFKWFQITRQKLRTLFRVETKQKLWRGRMRDKRMPYHFNG